MTVYGKVLVLVLERQSVAAIKQVSRKKMTFLGMYTDKFDLWLLTATSCIISMHWDFSIIYLLVMFSMLKARMLDYYILTNGLLNNLVTMMNFLIERRRNLVRNQVSNNQLRLLIAFLRKKISSPMILKVKQNCSKKRSISCLRVILQISGMTLMLIWVACHLN